MQESSLFVRQIGLGTAFSGPVMYEVRDARDQNNVVAILSGPGDDGIWRQLTIFYGPDSRMLTAEEMKRLNGLIKLQECEEDKVLNEEWDGSLED